MSPACTCVLDFEIQELIRKAKSKFSCQFYDRFKALVYIAYKLRLFDFCEDFVEIKFYYDGSLNELYLRIRCRLDDCSLKVVLNSFLQVKTNEIDWDESFVARTVQVWKRPSVKSWVDVERGVCDQIFDFWKSLISEGIVSMKL